MEGIGKEGCSSPLPSTRVHSIVKQCLLIILYFLYIYIYMRGSGKKVPSLYLMFCKNMGSKRCLA